METHDVKHFNQMLRERTKAFSVEVFKMLRKLSLDDLARIPARQLIRSTSSVAANFSSAARGRSEAEFYSKICIVVEECDESLFWFDFMIETGILNRINADILYKENKELLCLFSSIKRKLKDKRNSH